MDELQSQEVMRSLGRIEGTLESVLREQQEQNEYIIAVSKRVGSLELTRSEGAGVLAASRTWAAGVLAVMGAVFGVLGAFLKDWFL